CYGRNFNVEYAMKKSLMLALLGMTALAAGPSQEAVDTRIAFEEQGEVAFDPELSDVQLSTEIPALKGAKLKVQQKKLAKREALVRDANEEIAALGQEEQEVADEVTKGGAILIDLAQVFA